MKILNNNRGFSILEVILASAIFMLFASASVGVILRGFTLNRLGIEETVANQFASEGIEAVKSIKNQSYASLVNSQATGITQDAQGVWIFSGTNNTLPHNSEDDYTRIIKIEDVRRDGNGNIIPSGGILDPDSKKITSTVNWNFSLTRPESVTLSTYLSDWRKPIPLGGPVMMAYSKTTNTPYYRIWDGVSWGTEKTALTVGGNINYIVVKSSKTRNETILGTLDSNGNIYAQVWNGTDFGSLIQIAQIGASDAGYRSFDIDYETSSGKAVIVYLPNSGSSDFAYRTWDGSNWSSSATVTDSPTTGVVRWIESAANPTAASNEIAMIMLDSNTDVYGLVWDGNVWNAMGTSSVWDLSAATSIRKTIDVAYEQISGRAMFIWGDAASRYQYYRIWNGSSLTPLFSLNILSQGGPSEWIRLVSRPNSNEILYGAQDGGRDLNTRKWSGSGWDTATQHPEHDASLENTTSMNFDLVWETHPSNPGKAWLMWGAGSNISTRQWSGSGWGETGILTGSDDTSFIKLKSDPSSGAVLAGIYEALSSATDDLWESNLTGGGINWSAKNIIWPGSVSGEPVYFRVDISAP